MRVIVPGETDAAMNLHRVDGSLSIAVHGPAKPPMVVNRSTAMVRSSDLLLPHSQGSTSRHDGARGRSASTAAITARSTRMRSARRSRALVRRVSYVLMRPEQRISPSRRYRLAISTTFYNRHRRFPLAHIIGKGNRHLTTARHPGNVAKGDDTVKNQPRAAATKPHVSVHSYVHMRKRLGIYPYFKFRGVAPADASARGARPWSVPALCAAYNWPSGLTGGGRIAIVELGGGWTQSDMDAFFSGIGQSVPTITDISVDGTENKPDQGPNSADGEVALDIQVSAAAYCVATGHSASIRVYWSQDIAAAVRAATADGCDVCSISWGSDEANWRAQNSQAGADMELAATEATEAGMVVFAASGDNDSSDGGPTRANVDLPSSCPHIIGCGGTSKTASAETVWNNDPGNASGQGTGGGFSTMFQMPSWQAGAPHGPGRMVPDVAANADPNTGYEIILHGARTVIGGTSAVAPLYAGLFAAFGTKLGFITPALWQNHLCFNDITEGDNGAYRARIGPDPCTGLGSPIGVKLAQLLAHPAATAERHLGMVSAENARLRNMIANTQAAAADPTGCCIIALPDGSEQSISGVTRKKCDDIALSRPHHWFAGVCA